MAGGVHTLDNTPRGATRVVDGVETSVLVGEVEVAWLLVVDVWGLVVGGAMVVARVLVEGRGASEPDEVVVVPPPHAAKSAVTVRVVHRR